MLQKITKVLLIFYTLALCTRRCSSPRHKACNSLPPHSQKNTNSSKRSPLAFNSLGILHHLANISRARPITQSAKPWVLQRLLCSGAIGRILSK